MIKGGAAGGPALPVLFDLSGGQGRKGEGVPLCAALHSLFAHRGGVAQTPRRRGEEIVHPPRLAHVAHRRGAPTRVARVGKGEYKHTVCIPPPHLYTPVRMPRCAQRGRAPMWVEEGGRGVLC